MIKIKNGVTKEQLIDIGFKEVEPIDYLWFEKELVPYIMLRIFIDLDNIESWDEEKGIQWFDDYWHEIYELPAKETKLRKSLDKKYKRLMKRLKVFEEIKSE